MVNLVKTVLQKYKTLNQIQQREIHKTDKIKLKNLKGKYIAYPFQSHIEIDSYEISLS